HWFETKLNTAQLNKYIIWLAQYNDQVTYKGKYDIWQYSSKGSVAGINGNVDMNLSYMYF
ncbi:MAG: endolysin, partial [Clostridiales bacterium]|nr:endolysin [Clostridiales bacterium]